VSANSDATTVKKVVNNEGNKSTFPIDEPGTWELSKQKLNGIYERRLQISKGEMKGGRVPTNLCTDGGRRDGTVGLELDVMVHQGAERGDEVGEDVVEVGDTGDTAKGVLTQVLFCGAPDLAVAFVDDVVLVGVLVRVNGARRVRKKERIFVKIDLREGDDGGSRLYGGGGEGGRDGLFLD
jgi:hypothetical protein